MAEHRSRVEEDLEGENAQRRRAKRGDDRELDDHRQHDLDRVEPHPGGDVEFEIGVMHAVKPPQQRYRVEEHVLEIDREVEDDDRQPDLRARRAGRGC